MNLTKVVVAVLAALAVATGCNTKSPPPAPTSTATSTATTAAATTASQFSPQWMTLTALPSWTESNRRITREFQQFGLRPVGENEVPRGCNGCGVEPPTAFLTAYAPGAFDPTEARTGDAVTVNADNDGFFRAAENSGDAVLAWQYADNAWATVRGRTTMTSDRDRMLELAGALRPTIRAEIHAPLGIPAVPPSMPLAEITIDRGAYGTTLTFAKCGLTDIGGYAPCFSEGESMRVQVWPADDYSGLIEEKESVPISVGGRDGLYDEGAKTAAVKVQPGMLVVFQIPTPPSETKKMLAAVQWASDPGDERTWSPVADWVKVG